MLSLPKVDDIQKRKKSKSRKATKQEMDPWFATMWVPWCLIIEACGECIRCLIKQAPTCSHRTEKCWSWYRSGTARGGGSSTLGYPYSEVPPLPALSAVDPSIPSVPSTHCVVKITVM